MKKNVFKVISLLLIASMMFSLASCNGNKAEDETTTTAAAETTTITTTLAAEDNIGETTTATTAAGTTTTADSAVSATTATTTTAASATKTPAEILAIYTQVMNKAKTDKPAYKKYEYQEIPSDDKNRVVYEGKSYIGAILGIVDALKIITPKEEAMSNPEIKEKNSDMKWFPSYKTTVGCALSDATAIKEAKYEPQSDGTVKLTIVLKDEVNCEPLAENATTAPSATGGMFAPLELSEIDNTLTSNAIVTALIKDAKYTLTYHDCTATLVFKPDTNEIVSLDQVMVIKIEASAKAAVLFPVNLMQQLYNVTKFFDLVY